MGNRLGFLPSNDFEAVIRTSKNLEHILERDFGATDGNGLHQKVSETEEYWDQDTIRAMRYLATIRNKLVHEIDFNAIPDRARFNEDYRNALRKIEEVRKERGIADDSSCVIS